MKGARLVKYIRRVLNYDPETGHMTWRVSNSQVKRGQPAGSKTTKDGYLAIRLRKHLYPAHRVAWMHYHGEEPVGYVIDHINGDRLDNSIKNLRKATLKENAQNTRKRVGTVSKYKGVARHEGRWIAYIEVDGKRDYLGAYDTEQDAAMARIKAERERGWIDGQDHNVNVLLEEIL